MTTPDEEISRDFDQYIREQWAVLQGMTRRLGRTHRLDARDQDELLTEYYFALKNKWGQSMYLASTDERNAYAFKAMFNIARRHRIAALRDDVRHMSSPEPDTELVPEQLQQHDRHPGRARLRAALRRAQRHGAARHPDGVAGVRT